MQRTAGIRRRAGLREVIRGAGGDTRRATRATRGALYQRLPGSRESSKRVVDQPGRSQSLRDVVIHQPIGPFPQLGVGRVVKRVPLKQLVVSPNRPWVGRPAKPKR